MFEGCAITTAPDLLVATLPTYAYGHMFTDCSNLTRIRCLATDISAASCLEGWVTRVAASGTFLKASGSSWSTGNNGIPTGWVAYDDGDEPEPPEPVYDEWQYGGQTIEPPFSVNGEDGHSSNYAKGTFNFDINVIL